MDNEQYLIKKWVHFECNIQLYAITVRHDEVTGTKTLCCTSAIDNLIKGGAGQAIQSFNLMTGKPAHFGLTNPGLWP